MAVIIELYNEQTAIKDCMFDEDKITEIVTACLKSEKLDFDCQVGVTFTDNEGIRELNLRHREIDRETDVLSFPMLDDISSISEVDKNPENGFVYLGDIVISLEKAEAQAEEYGHGFEREVAFLIVHSMMHLVGYDHMEDNQRAVMRQHEEKVLTELGILR